MELTLNQQAISLAALMFVRGSASFESSLHDEEMAALHVLQQAKAIVPGVVNSRDAVCAFCGLYRGPIFRSDEGLMVQCPDCGPFALDPASQRSWRLDDEWLIRKLRGALDIAPHATTTQIVDGVWDIGRYKKRAVVLARRIDLVGEPERGAGRCGARSPSTGCAAGRRSRCSSAACCCRLRLRGARSWH